MKKKNKIVTILLAYNAAKTLTNFYREFPKKLMDDIILIDDASRDNTFTLAKTLNITSYKNPINLGYGGNMKRALAIALKRGADVIVDIHPDGEYKPFTIPQALKQIELGADLVLGNRFTCINQPLKSGMYIWKFFPIWILNQIDKIVLGVKVSDLHQGFRVYTKDLLSKINFEKNSNNYLFSFELIAQAVYNKSNIKQVPIETNYSGEKRGASFKNSIKYSLGTFKILALFFLAKAGFKIGIFQNSLEKLETRVNKLTTDL